MQVKTAITVFTFYRQITEFKNSAGKGVENGQPEQPSWSVSWRLPHVWEGRNSGPEFPSEEMYRTYVAAVHIKT